MNRALVLLYMDDYKYAEIADLIGISETNVSTFTLGMGFLRADDFHPPENVAKMKSGRPLDDSDCASWLASLHDMLSSSLKTDKPSVLACSALKELYRLNPSSYFHRWFAKITLSLRPAYL